MSSFNCCFLTCIQISQEAGKVVWYSIFPQSVLIHTVKGFGIVNKAGVDIFLELSCFFWWSNGCNYPRLLQKPGFMLRLTKTTEKNPEQYRIRREHWIGSNGEERSSKGKPKWAPCTGCGVGQWRSWWHVSCVQSHPTLMIPSGENDASTASLFLVKILRLKEIKSIA